MKLIALFFAVASLIVADALPWPHPPKGTFMVRSDMPTPRPGENRVPLMHPPVIVYSK